MPSPSSSRADVYRVADDDEHVDEGAAAYRAAPSPTAFTSSSRPRKLQQEVAASRAPSSTRRAGRHDRAAAVAATSMSDLVAIAATRRTVAAAIRLLPRRELEARATAIHAFCALLYQSQHVVLCRDLADALARRAHVDTALRYRRAAFAVAALVGAETIARFRQRERPAFDDLALLHATARAQLQEIATAHSIIACAIRVWRARQDRRRKLASIDICRSYRLASSVLRDALPRLWAERQHRRRMQPQQSLRRFYVEGRRAIEAAQVDSAVAIFATVAAARCADLASALERSHQHVLFTAFAAFAESCCTDTIWRDEANARRRIVADVLAYQHERVVGERMLAEAGLASLENVVMPHARAAIDIEQAERRRNGFPAVEVFVATCQIQRWVRTVWAERRNRALAHVSGVAEVLGRRVEASTSLYRARVDVAVATFAASAVEVYAGSVQELAFAAFIEGRSEVVASAMLAAYEATALESLSVHSNAVDVGLGLDSNSSSCGDGLPRAAALSLQRVCRGGRTRWRIEKTAAIVARERDWREVLMPLETPLDSARRIAGVGKAASARKAVARVHALVHSECRGRADVSNVALATAEALHRRLLSKVAFDHCLRLRRAASERAGVLLGAAIAETATDEAAERATSVAAWQRWFDITALQAATLTHVASLEGRLLRQKQVLGYRVTFEAIFRAHFGMRRIVAEEQSEWMKLRLLERGELRVVRLFEQSRAALRAVPPSPAPVKRVVTTPPLSRPGSATKANRHVRPPSAGRRGEAATNSSDSAANTPEAAAIATREMERGAAIRRETQALFARRLAAVERRESDERAVVVEAAELVQRGAHELERAHGVAAVDLLTARASDYDLTKLQLEWQMLADAAQDGDEDLDDEVSDGDDETPPMEGAAAAESLSVPQTAGGRRASRNFEETELQNMADDAFFSSDDEKDPDDDDENQDRQEQVGTAVTTAAATTSMAPAIVFNDSTTSRTSSSSSASASPKQQAVADETTQQGLQAVPPADAVGGRRASRNFEETELQNMADDAFFSSDDEKDPDDDGENQKEDGPDSTAAPQPQEERDDQQQQPQTGGLAAPEAVAGGRRASRNFEETELQNMADDAFFSSDDEKDPDDGIEAEAPKYKVSPRTPTSSSSSDGDDSVVYEESEWV